MSQNLICLYQMVDDASGGEKMKNAYPKNVLPTVKHGGSMLLCEVGMASNGGGNSHFT